MIATIASVIAPSILAIIYFYLTRRFKWITLGESKVLYYLNYQATVSPLELGGAIIEIHRAPAKRIYMEIDSSMSVRKAKRIAEDKILEFEELKNN